MPSLLGPDRPDWRWAKVVELSSYSPTRAAALLSREDALTSRLYAYKRALDRGLPDDDPEVEAAHTLYLQRPHDKMILEAFILSGASNDEIESYTWIDSSVVQVYHDAYFCVREGLSRPAWVCSAVFGGLPHQGSHQGDRHGLFMRLAWFGGQDVVEQMVSNGLSAPSLMDTFRRIVRDVLTRQAAEATLATGLRGDQAPDLLRLALDTDGNSGGGSDSDLTSGINKFLDGLALSVADPREDCNLDLPAREPRAAEYEVVEA